MERLSLLRQSFLFKKGNIMKELNLSANTPIEQKILDYIEQNASETLIDKINNGTPFVKNGKPLVNKKTLSGFMKYAAEEARKISEKGAAYACIDDSVVYGWAIHYFEEDSIEGTLFNPDGTEYTTAVKKPVIASVTPTKPKNNQPSLFDMLSKETDASPSTDEPTEEDITEAQAALNEDAPTVEEICDRVNKAMSEKHSPSPLYSRYKELEKEYPENILALRVGDFYEVFGNNAVKLAKELDLTLTSREVGLPERVPMIGFPYHAAKKYFSQIIALGYKISVCEGLKESPKEQPAQNIDYETGEILSDYPTTETPLVETLRAVLGDSFEVTL